MNEEDEADKELSGAVGEFFASLPTKKRKEYEQRMMEDSGFQKEMEQTVMSISNVFAASAMVKEDSEFFAIRQKALEEWGDDSKEAYAMRMFFLGRKEGDEFEGMWRPFNGREVFLRRLNEIERDYKKLRRRKTKK